MQHTCPKACLSLHMPMPLPRTPLDSHPHQSCRRRLHPRTLSCTLPLREKSTTQNLSKISTRHSLSGRRRRHHHHCHHHQNGSPPPLPPPRPLPTCPPGCPPGPPPIISGCIPIMAIPCGIVPVGIVGGGGGGGDHIVAIGVKIPPPLPLLNDLGFRHQGLGVRCQGSHPPADLGFSRY